MKFLDTEEVLTPGGQALKDFVDSSFDMGYSLDRAMVREVIRSPCGQKRPGKILGSITEFTKTGVMTKEHGVLSYNDMALNDQTIYLIRT